jgi:hypothetical protein
VYHGVLENGTQVAVKNLLNNRYQTTYQKAVNFMG